MAFDDMTFDSVLKSHRKRIERGIIGLIRTIESPSLRNPIAHIVQAGGKRIRPIITLLACEAAGEQATEALHAAIAVELLHTFTLVHDDIMDNATMRRGLQTVHTKWDSNVAILAGDTIAALAALSLSRLHSSRLQRIQSLFAEAFVEVCNGQAMDKEMETRHARVKTATMKEYFTMIEKKTAALFSMSAAIGGCIGSPVNRRIDALAKFGKEIGVAFQIRDDTLDIAADKHKFGKDSGGDIREGKKTFLYVTAAATRTKMSKADTSLIAKYATQKGLRGKDVPAMAELYIRSGAAADAEEEISKRTDRAIRQLDALPRSEAREHLKSVAMLLTARTF